MAILSPVNVFGAVSVTVMMIAYVGEERRAGYTLLFAFSCLAASAYGWISGTWPFGIIELAWGGFAFRKFYGRRHRGGNALQN